MQTSYCHLVRMSYGGTETYLKTLLAHTLCQGCGN